jgi:hypothetical protein
MHMEIECPHCKGHMLVIRDPNRHKKWHIKPIERREIRVDVDAPTKAETVEEQNG